MKELERTFLAREIPHGLKESKSKEIIDIYIPKLRNHPTLRIRKFGDTLEITKKEPVKGNDSSIQYEHTINLDKEEFDALNGLDGKRLHKIRYYYNYNGRIIEVDVFQDGLKGLIMIDVEFDSEEEKDGFEMPDFCLADITQEKFSAGGMLCGKSYIDIENDLSRFGYKKLIMSDGHE